MAVTALDAVKQAEKVKQTLEDAEIIFQVMNAAVPVRSVERVVSLPRNARVEALRMRVRARPALRGRALALGQLTLEPAVDTAQLQRPAVVDFGQPLTISRVALIGQSGLVIRQVTPWDGSRFSGSVFYGNAATAQFSTQVRTSRLSILIERSGGSGFPSGPTLADGLEVTYADSPADLEIRIDDGAPVWTSPGPVAPGQNDAVTTGAWSSEAYRMVDLTAAFRALTGDPLAAEAPVQFRVTLRSTNAGLLELEAPNAATGDFDVGRVRRVKFDGEVETTLDFAEEGARPLVLALPAASTRFVKQIDLTVLGSPPAERFLPAVGPAPFADAVLMLDPERAVAFALDDRGLDQLTGVRVPLRAGPSGAEVRVVLHGAGAGPGAPTEAVTDPVELPPGPAVDAEPVDTAWVTLRFPKPVDLDAAALPWAVLLLSRGEALCALAASGNASRIRRGAPTGPWLPLPGPFATGGAFAGAGPRLRQIGTHREGQIALLDLRLTAGGAALGATPKQKGDRRSFAPSVNASGALTLQIESRAGARITLRDVDVTTKET